MLTIKLGLSQSLIVHEATPNLNETLRGDAKKCWGLFEKVPHKTQQMTLFHPKRASLSFTTMDKAKTYDPTYSTRISYFMHDSPGMCYQSHSTTSVNAHNSVTLHLWVT